MGLPGLHQYKALDIVDMDYPKFNVLNLKEESIGT